MDTSPRQQTQEEQNIVAEVMMDFRELVTDRNVFAGQWEETSELIAPNYRNTFFYGSYNTQGEKKTYRQIDASGALALEKFAAICDSLLTPRNMYWHQLKPEDMELMKVRRVRLFFDKLNHLLFRLRYAETAGFAGQNYLSYFQLGAFGNGPLFIDALYSNTGEKGLRYGSLPLGEVFMKQNHQGVVDGFTRWFRLTARQIKQKFGEENFPHLLRPDLERNSATRHDILQRVVPREDWDKERLDAKGKRWRSDYVCIKGQCVLSTGGYNSFPMPCARYVQAPNEVYARGPAQFVLPGLKTLNSQKSIFLKQGHRASDPVLLTADDGLLDLQNRPGAINKGGMNQEGRMLVGILPTGNIAVNEKMMAEEKMLINDAFLVTLFQILTETPQMTATEVIERTNEKGILLAPTVGRQQSEYLGPMIERELDVAAQLRLLPPLPPELKEAGSRYKAHYTSPIARAMRAQEAAGFMRTVESVKELVNITGDPSLLDPFDFDTAIPAIAEIQAVPEGWMADQSKMQMKRQNRAQAQAKQQQIQALPAQAAMIKAQATMAKAQPGVAQGQSFGGPMPGQAQGPQGPGGQ